jgi:hypothetical protein
MRSRYTAFVKRDIPTLFWTLHREHPNKAAGDLRYLAGHPMSLAELGGRTRIDEFAQ